MQAEALRSQGFQPWQARKQLVLRPAVLGIPGTAHDGVAQMEFPAGVKTGAHGLGHAAVARQQINVALIIQVDDRAQGAGVGIFRRGHGVGAEHDAVARKAAHFRQLQLAFAGAVQAAALFLENLQHPGIGQGFHRKIFPKTRRPGKSRVQVPGRFSDARFVIQMKGGGKQFRGFFKYRVGQRKIWHSVSSFRIASFVNRDPVHYMPSKKPGQAPRAESTN